MEKLYRLEGMVKGFANHRRIEILYLLEKNPELSAEKVEGRGQTYIKLLRE